MYNAYNIACTKCLTSFTERMWFLRAYDKCRDVGICVDIEVQHIFVRAQPHFLGEQSTCR